MLFNVFNKRGPSTLRGTTHTLDGRLMKDTSVCRGNTWTDKNEYKAKNFEKAGRPGQDAFPLLSCRVRAILEVAAGKKYIYEATYGGRRGAAIDFGG